MSGILEVGFYMDRKAIWNISLSTDFNLLSLGSAASKIVSRKFSSMGITQNDWSGKEPLEVPGRDSLLNCIWEHCKVVITRQSIWRQMKKLCVKKYSAALCCDTGVTVIYCTKKCLQHMNLNEGIIKRKIPHSSHSLMQSFENQQRLKDCLVLLYRIFQLYLLPWLFKNHRTRESQNGRTVE